MILSGFRPLQALKKIATAQQIPLTTLASHPSLDLTIDGADEGRCKDLNLIKGGGAALVREKIIANASKEILIVVDESKVSRVLGTIFPLPVEIVRVRMGGNTNRSQSDLRKINVTPRT